MIQARARLISLFPGEPVPMPVRRSFVQGVDPVQTPADRQAQAALESELLFLACLCAPCETPFTGRFRYVPE